MVVVTGNQPNYTQFGHEKKISWISHRNAHNFNHQQQIEIRKQNPSIIFYLFLFKFIFPKAVHFKFHSIILNKTKSLFMQQATIKHSWTATDWRKSALFVLLIQYSSGFWRDCTLFHFSFVRTHTHIHSRTRIVRVATVLIVVVAVAMRVLSKRIYKTLYIAIKTPGIRLKYIFSFRSHLYNTRVSNACIRVASWESMKGINRSKRLISLYILSSPFHSSFLSVLHFTLSLSSILYVTFSSLLSLLSNHFFLFENVSNSRTLASHFFFEWNFVCVLSSSTLLLQHFKWMQ